MKKIILIVLSVAIILSSLGTMLIFALDSGEYTKDSILVNFCGTESYLDVFVSEGGTVLLPADILTSFGGLKRITDGSEYIYSLSGSKNSSKFERQIIIAKNGSYGKTILHIPNKADLSGVNVNFKDSYTFDGDLFLPLEEIVPFLDATMEIKDGSLHIYPSAVSVFEAISSHSFQDLFDSEYSDSIYNILYDVSDGNGVGALSLFVDSIVNFRLDRLDKIFHTGEIKDYKALFGKILLENEAYLSAFDEEKTPLDNVFADMNEYIGDGNKYIKLLDGALGKTEKILKYELGSEKFKKYQDFSNDVKSFGDISLMVDVIYKAVDYADVFTKMVDDHYNMLDVVYGNGNFKGTPIGTAANEVVDYYSGERGKAIKSAGVSALRETLFEIATKPVEKAIAPYTIVLDAIKLIPGMDELSRDYNVFYIDAVVSDSRKAFVNYYNNASFDTESLNNLRLSLLMTMVTSKYGYDTTAMFPVTENPDDIQYGSIKNNHRLELNSWVEKLYLAADSVEHCTPEYYSKMKAELSANVQYLQFVDCTNPDVPDIPESTEYSEGLEFTINEYPVDGGYSVTGIGTCTDTDIVIPKTYKGRPVTGIKYRAFANCTSLTSVTIPNSVKSIGYSSFEDCTSLTSIIIPSSVTSISGFAFCDCTSLTNVFIPNSVTSIGDGAFRSCTSLTSIMIPNSVTNFGSNVFENCWSLKYNEYDNAIYLGNKTNPYHVLIKAKDESITSCEIHKDTKIIAPWAFAYRDLLIEVNIPDNVTSISYNAFFSCDLLASITIPNSVTSIGVEAFAHCPSLENIIIPHSVTSIGYATFYGCTSLTNAIIGASVASMDQSVFAECPLLQYNEYDNALYLGSKTNPYHVLIKAKDENISSCIIHSNTKVIYANAFSNCTSLTDVTIPDGVWEIGVAAFHSCTSLISITIPDSVTLIDSSAFANCTSIKSAVIGDSVTNIGGNAFENCRSLTTLTIGGSVTYIGPEVFYECYSLKDIYYTSDIEGWCNIYFEDGLFEGSNPMDYGECIYIDNKRLSEVVIPNSVMSLENTFAGWSWLEKVIIPDSVVVIGGAAFANCTALKNISLPNSIATIGGEAFMYCESLQSVTIPDSVTSIGLQAFYCCTSLENVTIPDSVTSIGTEAFYNCRSLKSIKIPDCVNGLGGGIFSYCYSLMNVELGNSITELPSSSHHWGFNVYGMFNACTSLESIVIPESVNIIDECAFAGCTSLTSVTIPKSVTTICDKAFRHCTSLTSINYEGTKAQWDEIFKGSYWNDETGTYTIYCTDGTIVKDGTVTYY